MLRPTPLMRRQIHFSCFSARANVVFDLGNVCKSRSPIRECGGSHLRDLSNFDRISIAGLFIVGDAEFQRFQRDFENISRSCTVEKWNGRGQN
jgi:hypothetical protein